MVLSRCSLPLRHKLPHHFYGLIEFRQALFKLATLNKAISKIRLAFGNIKTHLDPAASIPKSLKYIDTSR